MDHETNIPHNGMQNEEETSEKTTPWVGLLRYHKSFTAKLLLSDLPVREYYAEIATELLSYARVRSRTGWAGVTFSVGRAQLARCTINGKTLCLYLAADPEEFSGGRYKARGAAARKYEKTPALFRVKSAGGARNAVAKIAEVAAGLGLAKKDPLPEPISAKAFPRDSFQNLITRGLIRLMKGKSAGEPGGERPPETAAPVTTPAETPEQGDAYTDTVEAVRGVIGRHAAYGSICEALDAGDASVKLSQKTMLRAIDEDWVRRVEDSLVALDELIRRPSHYIAETEEILPMELTKKITGRYGRNFGRSRHKGAGWRKDSAGGRQYPEYGNFGIYVDDRGRPRGQGNQRGGSGETVCRQRPRRDPRHFDGRDDAGDGRASGYARNPRAGKGGRAPRADHRHDRQRL